MIIWLPISGYIIFHKSYICLWDIHGIKLFLASNFHEIMSLEYLEIHPFRFKKSNLRLTLSHSCCILVIQDFSSICPHIDIGFEK